MPRHQKKQKKNWDDVPEDVKNTFEKLGIPEAEKKIFKQVQVLSMNQKLFIII